MTLHDEVAISPVVKEAMPALAAMAGSIGDPAVRHRGTIGGSVANNDPNADYPAACLGLGATIITNKRRIAADEFFNGLFETALEPDEIITKVMFPLAKKAAYQKFRNPASRYALVGVFVAKRRSEIRVAVTGAGGNGVFRVASFEEALKKRFSPKSLEGMSIPAEGLAQRHPRERRISRASRRCHGAPCGGRRGRCRINRAPPSEQNETSGHEAARCVLDVRRALLGDAQLHQLRADLIERCHQLIG